MNHALTPETIRRGLDELYVRFTRRELVHPDPLEFVYRYPDPKDREIVALIAASLAYGRVSQILRSVENALGRIPSPARFLRRTADVEVCRAFLDFKHRFTTGEEMAFLLLGIKQVIKRHGSLFNGFKAGLSRDDEDVLPALAKFVAQLNEPSGGGCGSLLASPVDGSACKRMNLFLRWMVRQDAVDPGGWEAVGARRLVVPLDTHIYRLCRMLRLTTRNQPNLRTALEITDAFRRFAPDDPIRYDFAISRIGIRRDMDVQEFLNLCRAA